MNSYVFVLLLVLIGVGAYLFMTKDHDKIADAMNFGTVPSTSTTPAPAPGASTEVDPYDGSTTSHNMPPLNLAPKEPNAASASPALPGPESAAIVPPNIAKVQATGDNSSAIDAAAVAASSSSAASNLGTIKTLTNHTYTNCKVLKVDDDGVTFTCDEGIVKLLFPVLPPDVQKKFGYDPQKAVQQTQQKIDDAHEQQAEAQAAHPAQ